MPEIRVGTPLYGYCGGCFGRGSYDVKRVEAIGHDWVVARSESGTALFADVAPEELAEYASQKARLQWESGN